MEKDQADYPAHAAPVRLAFRVSYLGSRFYGSQMQAAYRTVEGEFIAACQRMSLFGDWRKAGFLSAGRTAPPRYDQYGTVLFLQNVRLLE